ncbi:hypothetical protein C0993_008459 [Termitomyces sp. T159_Od127]|nr:hypothetical protein C0993_008459 [Termitomyces sp. T159_Od127]
MIQQTNPRLLDTSVASLRQAAQGQDGPEQWGLWQNQRHYSLEVVQNPLRARMCGFGDKDRRPLAPAAVAKMIVKREDDSIVDVDDVDCSFFLVTVDLWSEDGKQEMNLVLHPSSTDRFVPTHTTKTRRRGTSSSTPHPRSSGNQTPISHSTSSSVQFRSGEQAGGITTPSMTSQATNFNGHAYYPPMADNLSFSDSASYSTTTAPETPTWGYSAQSPSVERNAPFPPQALPSITSFSRTASSSLQDSWQSEQEPEGLPCRAWGTDTAYQSMDAYHPQIDPTIRVSNSDGRDESWAQEPERYGNDVNQTQVNSSYPSTGYAQPQAPPPPPFYSSNLTPVVQTTATLNQSSASVPLLPRHTYTRTLIGPLSANACRLLDEHRKPGIFFLFQDLSVRTEGDFSFYAINYV